MGERVIRDFGKIVALIARGRLLEKLDDEVAELLDQLEATGEDKAKGSLTLTIEFQRLADRTDVSGKITVKPPAEKALPATTLFNVEGGLSVQHPGQMEMFGGPRAVADRETA